MKRIQLRIEVDEEDLRVLSVLAKSTKSKSIKDYLHQLIHDGLFHDLGEYNRLLKEHIQKQKESQEHGHAKADEDSSAVQTGN